MKKKQFIIMHPPAGQHVCPHCNDFQTIVETVRQILTIVQELQDEVHDTIEWLKESGSHASGAESDDQWEEEDDSESEL